MKAHISDIIDNNKKKSKPQLLRHLWQLAPLSDIVLILYLSLAVYEPWSVLVFYWRGNTVRKIIIWSPADFVSLPT